MPMNHTYEVWKDRLLSIFETIELIAVMLDRDGNIHFCNDHLLHLTGWKREEVSGKSWFNTFLPKDVSKGVRSEVFDRMFQSGEFPEHHENEIVTREGGRRLVKWNNTVFYDADGNVETVTSIGEDITERKHTEERMRQYREKLELQVQERTAELKTRTNQLSQLSLKLALAEQDERDRIAGILHDHLQQFIVGAKMGQELLIRDIDDSLKSDARRVLDLINQSLDASRNLSAELSPNVLRSLDFSESLEFLAQEFLKNHGFQVDLHIEKGVVLDQRAIAVLLYQSVRELLLNAVKHSGTQSATIKLSLINGELRMVVRDEGKGFNPEAERRKDGDKYFGLFGVQERLCNFGGNLEIASEPNKGATISITLPMDKATPVVRDNTTETLKKHEQLHLEMSEKKLRILLVDDHHVMREGLSKMLGAEPDFDIVGEASDGNEAVQMARKAVPDVILMDINMPHMDGLEATRIIHAKHPHVRIIALTMYENGPIIKEILKSGASAYCSKGGDTELLLATIRHKA